MFQWEADVPLITNRFFLYDLLKWYVFMILFSTAVIATFYYFDGMLADSVEIILFTIPAYAIMVAILLIVISLYFKNKWPCEYTLDAEGVSCRTIGNYADKTNQLVATVGELMRMPPIYGTGRSRQPFKPMRVSWSDVHSVRYHDSANVITLKGRFMVRLRLYCTEFEYGPACQVIEEHTGLVD